MRFPPLTARLFGVTAGAVFGAIQVHQDNVAQWRAIDTSLVTRAVEMAGGASIGGLLVFFAMTYYGVLRLRPIPAVRRRLPTSLQPETFLPRRPVRLGIRHILIFLFGTALLCAGLFLLVPCIMHPSIYGLLRGVLTASFLIGLGGYMIWNDLVMPRLPRSSANALSMSDREEPY